MNRRERRAQWQASQRRASSSESTPAAPSAVPATIVPQARPVPAFAAVNLQIDMLVLRGFERHQSSRIAAAFERSLSARMRTGVLPESLRHHLFASTLRLAPLTLRRATDPVAIGEQLAASVYAFERGAQRQRVWG